MTLAAPLPEILNRRVLVIDDNEAILADFRKILTPATPVADSLLAAEVALFGTPPPPSDRIEFELTTASQGRAGFELARQARDAGQPFALAFVDMRMPPGWNGLETIEQLWTVDPDLEVVICTAFSDHSWEETVRRLKRTDRLLVVKKPFATVEVLQIANALTQKWNLQRQARHTLDGLDALVRARTEELESARDALLATNRELAAARDAAEAASRSKSLFLANISHELRTPLTAIVGYTEEIRDRVRGRADLEFEFEALATIHRNAQHLVLLIGDLLDFSKLEAGKMCVESVACSPLAVARDVADLMTTKADDKGITLTLAPAPDLPPAIMSDPLRLRQILLNLVDNAIKFTARGEVRLTVAVDADRAHVVFAIRDEGCGMTAETVRRLFRPFEQADVTTTRKYGGTGLGLAISRQLAEVLGGGIEVTSDPGVGSTFAVRVPARCTDESPVADRAAGTACGERLRLPVKGTRVLLVEDGKDNQRLITHLLRRVGVEIEVADDGAQCLERIGAPGERKFDLVLMDLQMPVMDGLTATTHARGRGHTVPIVALSASAMLSDREACEEAGCTAFLAKPIDRARLLDAIARLVPRPLAR